MSRSKGGPKEIAVPISVFGSLRTELEKEFGMLPAVRSLHHAGYQAGLAAAAIMNQEAGGDSLSLGQSSFWRLLSDYFSRRGWGTLSHRSPHTGVGILTSRDWVEAGTDGENPGAGCSFSVGFFAGLLSQLADGPVAVLEVACRMRGDKACDFAFGSEAVIHSLYGHLLEGADLATALKAL
jgi:hypothetical protein